VRTRSRRSPRFGGNVYAKLAIDGRDRTGLRVQAEGTTERRRFVHDCAQHGGRAHLHQNGATSVIMLMD
jgi:hypothetical protein